MSLALPADPLPTPSAQAGVVVGGQPLLSGDQISAVLASATPRESSAHRYAQDAVAVATLAGLAIGGGTCVHAAYARLKRSALDAGAPAGRKSYAGASCPGTHTHTHEPIAHVERRADRTSLPPASDAEAHPHRHASSHDEAAHACGLSGLVREDLEHVH